MKKYAGTLANARTHAHIRTRRHMYTMTAAGVASMLTQEIRNAHQKQRKILSTSVVRQAAENALQDWFLLALWGRVPRVQWFTFISWFMHKKFLKCCKQLAP